MLITEMQELVAACAYKPGWSIDLRDEYGAAHGVRPYIQLSATTPCSITGETVPWRSAKVYLSEHMCRQEVVGAVFGLIERAELHEMREFFRFRGACIYSPHMDPDVLVPVARKASSFNMRENAMTMETS